MRASEARKKSDTYRVNKEVEIKLREDMWLVEVMGQIKSKVNKGGSHAIVHIGAGTLSDKDFCEKVYERKQKLVDLGYYVDTQRDAIGLGFTFNYYLKIKW